MKPTPSQSYAEICFESWLKDIHMGGTSNFILKGSAGSGKSWTLSNRILPKLQSSSIPYYLTATTNQAIDSLGIDGIQTLHQFLGVIPYSGKYVLNPKQFLDCGYRFKQSTPSYNKSIIVVDEAYRIDQVLLDIAKYLHPNAVFLFIGDPFQTPPIGMKRSPIEDLPHSSVLLRETPRFLNGGNIASLVSNFREAVENETKDYMQILPIQDSSTTSWLSRLEVKEQLDAAIAKGLPIDYRELCILSGTKKIANQYNNYICKERARLGLPVIFASETVYIDFYAKRDSLEFTATMRQYSKFKCTALDITKKQHIKAKEAASVWKVPASLEKHLGTIIECTQDSLVYIRPSSSVEDIPIKVQNQIREFSRTNYIAIICIRLNVAKTIHLAQGITSKIVYLDVGSIIKWSNHDMKRRLFYTGISRCSEKLILMR